MRRRSFSGPLILLIVGGVCLWSNLHPEVPIFDLISNYWPFLLIGWGLLRLIEVAFFREARQGGFSGGEIVLVILICMAGSITWAARENGIRFNNRGLDWWGSQFEYPLTAHADAAGAKRIVFENPLGNIRVTGVNDAKEVTVTGHKSIRSFARADADKTDANTPIEIVPQGDRLLIRTNQDRARDNQRISDELEVTVPRSMAVEARGHNGDFEISDIGGDVELASDHGDTRLARLGSNARIEVGRSDLIRVIDLQGRLDITGRGSDVELENIGGQVTINGAYNGTLDFKKLAKPLQFEGARNTELSVQAVPGHINMDLGSFSGTDLTGPIRLTGNSRDIRIEQFTQSLELQNDRGDVELHPGRLPLASIEAHSGSGRIDLILPDKATFQIDATAEHGEAFNDFGPGISQESDGRTATIRGKVGEGPTIHITTNRGRISVRKEGTPPSDGDATPETPKKVKI